MATRNAYGSPSGNMSSGLHGAQLAEPSRSVRIRARVSVRGLCLSCCSLAYGTVQMVALPAHLTACLAASQERRRASFCTAEEKPVSGALWWWDLVMQGEEPGLREEGRAESNWQKERGSLWKLTALHSHVQAVWLPTATRHDVIGS